MCLLDACCYCIFLDIGCVLIAVIILIFRILIIVAMLNNPNYKDFDITEDFSAAHVTIIIAAIGCIIPIFLMWGVCTGSPTCVCSFITLEIVYVLVNMVWELYSIINYYSNGEDYESYYDVVKTYSDDYYNDYYYDDDYYDKRDRYKKIAGDDLFWLAPILFFLLEGYFIWVAYSYYRFLQDEYDDFYYGPDYLYA